MVQSIVSFFFFFVSKGWDLCEVFFFSRNFEVFF